MRQLLPLLWTIGACSAAPIWTTAGAIAPARTRLDVDHDGRVTGAEYARVAFAAPDFGTADLDHDGDLSVGELEALVNQTDPKHFFVVTDINKPAVRKSRPIKKNKAANAASEAARARALAGGPAGAEATTAVKPAAAGIEKPLATAAEGPEPAFVGAAPGAEVSRRPRGDVLRPAGITTTPPESYFVLLALRDEVRSADPTVAVPDDDTLQEVGWAGSLTTPEARAVLAQLESASAAAHVEFPAALRAKGR